MNVTERCCAVKASCLGCYDNLRELRMAPRGRAPQGEYSNKLATLSTRITEDLRRALETAKTESGRSLSQEIEARLRASFENERAISDAFGDRQTYAVMRIIGGVLDALRNPGEDRPDWLDDPYAHDAMVGAVLNVLEVFRPRSEEHTSELQSLMPITYAVLRL